MDMPKTVRVGPHVYSVLRKPASAMGENLGHCDSAALQIWIKERLRKSKAQEILLHELLHAIILQCLNTEEAYVDETFILAVSPLLLQMIHANPDLLAYLTQ
jgi:hypothetical protein